MNSEILLGSIDELQVTSGSLVRTTTASIDVKCGFRPKKIILIKGNIDSSTVANGDVRLIYDEDLSSNYIVNDFIDGSGTKYVMNSPLSNLLTINDDGFTFLKAVANAWAGTYYYTAIGYHIP